jgi:hypothetical protein
MSAGEAKKVMQSALDQWLAIEHLNKAAHGLLSEDECQALADTTRDHASKTLHNLDERRRKTLTPPSTRPRGANGELPESFQEEPTEIREIRELLERRVGEG